MIIAETNRLLIEEITLKDAPFMVKLLNTPNFIKFIGDRKVKTVEEAETYLKNGILKNYEEYGYGFYKLLLKEENNKAIGTSGLVKREQLNDVDYGFALLPEYEGKGFGYESSVAILELAKTKFKLETVLAISLKHNVNSIKLLEKLGWRYQKTVELFDDVEELLLFSKTL